MDERARTTSTTSTISKKRGRAIPVHVSQSQHEDTSARKRKKTKAKDNDVKQSAPSPFITSFLSATKNKSKKKKTRKSNNTSTQSPSTSTTTSTSKKSQLECNINPSIPISKADHAKTLKLLQSMDWTMAQNTSRRNVIRANDKATPRNKMGKPYCMSFIFGRNMKDPTGSQSYWASKYPQVYSELQSLMAKYDPQFSYTHITLNCNLRCKRHTDGGNKGPSYIAAFGNFTGGGLIVEPPGGGQEQVLDLKSQFVKFNGKTQPHETAPFQGERFTLVFYTSDIVPPTVDRRAYSHAHAANTSTKFVSQLPSADNDSVSVDDDWAKKLEATKAKLGRKKKGYY